MWMNGLMDSRSAGFQHATNPFIHQSTSPSSTRETLIYPQMAQIDADGRLETSAKICVICGRKSPRRFNQCFPSS
jgi:hypothetical protein